MSDDLAEPVLIFFHGHGCDSLSGAGQLDNTREMSRRMFARMITDAANASGTSHREVRNLAMLEYYARGFGYYAYLGGGPFVSSLAQLVRDADDLRVHARHAEEHAAARAVVDAVEPEAALRTFLEWMIHVGRRAVVSHQLAVQRLKLVCRAMRSSPDVPPGEVVVSSACVPRGPGLPRVVSTLLSSIRGDRLALV